MIQVLFRKTVGPGIAALIHNNMRMAIHGAASRISSEIVFHPQVHRENPTGMIRNQIVFSRCFF